MASERSDKKDGPEEPHEPRECMPCRGTGSVISRLGGEPATVTCPWCEGSGSRIPGIDAQARWAAERAEDAPESAASPAD